MLKKIKNSKIMKPIKKLYRRIRFQEYLPFETPAYVLDNSKKNDTVCLILAGYKEFTWDILFKRLKLFCPENIDICIVSSGLYSEKLNAIAEENNWSYISMKRNNVCIALNSAINYFTAADFIYKIDEDIFLTEGFFQNLKDIYFESKKNYFPCFSAPLIPINGYGYRKILEKLNLIETYTNKFEYPIFSAGSHMKIENDISVAKFMWGADNFVPQIDKLNRFVKSIYKTNSYTVCPIRFSIGAIFFEKKNLIEFGYFPVKIGTGMGKDEEFLCNQATSKSKAIIVSENQVVGHLSFGSQNNGMREYFLNNTHIFNIEEEQ